jgi:protein-S-isoprenylcysteine O-methyltransferase Ste14
MRDALRALARARVPLGFVAGAIAFWLAAPDCRSVAAGGAIGLAGEALRIWAAGHLDKSREVTSSGPYRYFAHPLYTGSAIMGAGLAIASRSILVALLIAVYFVVTITAAVRTEEAFLRAKFGDEYANYRSSRNAGSPRPFQLARVRQNREYRAALGLLAVMVLFAWRAGCL